MSDHATVDDLKQRGASVPAPEAVRALYRDADVLAITESLRVEGGLPGRRLAERLVAACRAAL